MAQQQADGTQWTIVPVAAARPQPWPNGGGVTRELLAWPAAGDCRLRLSVADVHRGTPLTRFPGHERWLAVLDGEGVMLRVPGTRHRVTRHGEPLRFDANLPLACRHTRGAMRTFEAIAAPGAAALCRVHGDLAFATGGPALLAVYAHASPVQVRPGDSSVLVPPYHLGWRLLQGPVSGMVSAVEALWVEATPWP
jgi:environmental stress-induced protein Ves